VVTNFCRDALVSGAKPESLTARSWVCAIAGGTDESGKVGENKAVLLVKTRLKASTLVGSLIALESLILVRAK
jgi:hypothetical protein